MMKSDLNQFRNNFFKAILILSILLLGIFLFQITNTRGVENREEVIAKYLNTLTNQDYFALQKLTPSDFDSKEAIQKEFEEFGGNKFENITVTYSESIKSGLWYATIQGTRIDLNNNHHVFSQTLTLKGGPKRWFLRLGKQKSNLPPIDAPPLKINPSDYPFASITRNVEKEMERRVKKN